MTLTFSVGDVALLDPGTGYAGTSPDGTGSASSSSMAPVLSLASDLQGLASINQFQLGRTFAPLLVSAQAGSQVNVQVSDGITTITKVFTGSGGLQGVVLFSSEVASLANGTINVSATATDAMGIISASGTLSFAYQTVPPLGTLSVTATQAGNETGPIDSIFTIHRSGSSTDPISVRYSLGGSALEGEGLDYRFADPLQATRGYGEVTLAAGQSSASITLPTIDNDTANNSRNIIFNFIRPGDYGLYYLVDTTFGSAGVALIDNDTAIALINVSDLSVVEGDSSEKFAYIAVSLDRAVNAPVSVSYSFANGTAFNGVDYSATAGTLTFDANTRNRFISVTIFGNTIIEANKTFTVQLSDPSQHAALGLKSSATITIVDDEQDPLNPTAGITITTSGSFSGTDRDDVLIGSSDSDTISGLSGNDIIAGKGGSDVLSGGAGNDLFIYTDLSDSTLAANDRITDFRPDISGDRLVVNSLPGKLWNVGRITASTLASALSIAFSDAQILIPGEQELGANDAILFTWGTRASNQRLYVAINDAVAGLQPEENPFLVELGTLQQYITQTGELNVDLIFQALEQEMASG